MLAKEKFLQHIVFLFYRSWCNYFKNSHDYVSYYWSMPGQKFEKNKCNTSMDSHVNYHIHVRDKTIHLHVHVVSVHNKHVLLLKTTCKFFQLLVIKLLREHFFSLLKTHNYFLPFYLWHFVWRLHISNTIITWLYCSVLENDCKPAFFPRHIDCMPILQKQSMITKQNRTISLFTLAKANNSNTHVIALWLISRDARMTKTPLFYQWFAEIHVAPCFTALVQHLSQKLMR